ncbi:unnamed protein product [Closterium sp. NIES-54]
MRPTTLPCPACKRAALPPPASRCPAQRTVSALLPNVPCTPTCPTSSRCLCAPTLPRAYRQLPLSHAHAPTGATATASATAATAPTVPATATAVATLYLAPLLLTNTAYHGHYHCHSSAAAECAGVSLAAAASRRHEWAVRWGATTGGTSNPAGSAASRRGVSGGGQQRPLETLSPQQLCEWAVSWGSPGGGGFRGTRTGGVEAPGSVEATSLGACDSASAGAEPEEALHTFTLDSGASHCFFRNSTTVTALTAPVPVTLADPSGGPVVAHGATVLLCPATPSGLLIGLHLPSFAKNLVATFVLWDQWVSQVAASVEVTASCSCRLLTHQNLLWHQRLGHPSLPRLCGMHSRLLISGLPKSLHPLPRSLALPCFPASRGGSAPLLAPPRFLRPQLLYRPSTWTKAEVRSVLIRWIRAVRRQLSARFQQDLPVLRLHSNRGGEFSSGLLENLCGAEGIRQTFTLPASPLQNGIAERRIGLVMEVSRTSIVHVATPNFLWPFALRYAAEKLSLWPRVSHPETSPAMRWTGEVGDASSFWVWGALLLVRDPPTGRISPRTLRCIFLSFPTDAPSWKFYHLGSRRVLSSQDVNFDESFVFYRLHPQHSSPVPLPPLALVSDPPPLAPLPPKGPAPSSVSQVDPSPLVEPVEVSSNTFGPAEGGDSTPAVTVTPLCSARLAVPLGFPPRPSSPHLQPVAVDSGAAGGGATGGADSGGAGAGGTGARRHETLSPERLREWAVQWSSPGGGASCARTARAGRAGAAVSGGAGPGGAIDGVPGVGRAGGTGTRGTRATGGSGGAGPGGAGTGGTCAAGGTRGAGPVGASAVVPRVGGTGGADTGGATRGTGVGGAVKLICYSLSRL